ncbi:MAG: hypothetical protein ABSF26_13910 [Thermoguttaceae bacterium]|jgi:hypothetical protein
MSGTLPLWLERWLGLAGPRGEGTAWRLAGRWPWPPWLTLLAAAAAIAFVVAIYLREGRHTSRRYRLALAVVRLAALAVVAAMVAQVEISLRRTGLPLVAVLLDDSRSMAMLDNYPQPLRESLVRRLTHAPPQARQLTRWNLARGLLAEDQGAVLAELAESYKLRFYFLTGLRASRRSDVPGILEELAAAEPTGDSTPLGAAVRGVLDDLRGTSPAAVILLTDGINTEGPTLAEAAAYARRKAVPLFFVGIGSDQPVREVKLSDLLVDDVVFVDDLVDFRLQLTATGLLGTKLSVVLRREGKPDVLARSEVTVGADGQPQEVRILYRPTEVGTFRYRIEVEPPPGGLQANSPPLLRAIQVRKEKLRVLLAQAAPSFEYRFLRNLLAREETVELRTVLQEADAEYAQEDAASLRIFPVRRDELFAYDVVILGDVNPALLSPTVWQNLADFVDQPARGGALVLVAGPRYMPQALRDTPLARCLPFDLGSLRDPDPNKPLAEGFVVRPTELGLASPAMQLADRPEESRALWQGLPPLYWMVEAADLKPSARVLAEHPTRSGPDGRRLPVIVMHYAGAGKVLFHATDETWRWRRLGPAPYARYWLQTIRYLSRSKLAEGDRSARLSTDRREYRVGEPVRLEVRFIDDRVAPADDHGVTVVLEHPGHQTRRLQLHRLEAGRGAFEGLLSTLPAGGYHAWIAVPALAGRAPAVDFAVAPPPGELARVQMETAEMRQAAEITKGRCYTLADAGRLLDDLPEGRQVPIENLPPLTVWNKWPVLLVLLVLLTGEWILRKRGGMA